MCGPRASRAHLQGPRTQVVKESSSGAGVRGSATLPSPASGSRRPAAVGVRSLGTARPRGLGPRSGAGPQSFFTGGSLWPRPSCTSP